jgi:hypothetical protein
MNVTDYATKDYVEKQELLRMEKQTQSNPIYSVFIRVNSWLNSKQTQMPLGMAYATKPILVPSL